MPTLIKPLTIGNLTFPYNLIQGPLAGYSCAPFRKLFSHFLPPAYCVTEMLSAQDLLTRTPQKPRYVWRDPAEKRLCYQLSGHDADVLSEATAIVTRYGADLIDLNCGCPKPKIRKKQAGSHLLRYPDQISRIVAAMKSATDKPVTVKIRVSANHNDMNNLDVAQAIEAGGADALIVHGRHWQEDYDIPCHIDQIAEIVASVKIPVVANGDIRDTASLQQVLQQTQCAGIMISRGGTGRPWIFQQLLAESTGQPYQTPTLATIINLFLQHIGDLAALENETAALLTSRSLIKYYFRSVLTEQLKTTFYQLRTFEELQMWCYQINIEANKHR